MPGTAAAISPGIMRGLAFAPAFLALILAGSTTSRASDHVDGIKTGLDNAADLTDIFTFTSPSDPSKLVLVMNTHPLAVGVSRFSNAIEYKFRIRPIADARTLTPTSDASKEQTIVCTFSGGIALIDANQRATCKLNLANGSETITFSTRTSQYDAGGSTSRNGINAFAGVRSDPWFLDLGKTLKYNKGQAVPNGAGSNGLWGWNVLSIVIEVPKERFGSSLLAVTAQTVRK
jgi:hypothetical protein